DGEARNTAGLTDGGLACRGSSVLVPGWQWPQRQSKCAPSTRCAAYQRQASTEPFGQPSGESEPQARAAVSSADGGVGLFERLEEEPMSIFGDTDPRVGHLDDALFGVGPADGARGNENGAGGGELDCIRNQVDEDLP